MSGSITTLGIPKAVSEEVEEKRSQSKLDTETLRASFSKDGLKWGNVDWIVTGFLFFIHLGCFAALVPAFFSWQALAVGLGLHWFTCSIGICLGYHRYLSHKSFKLRAPAEFMVLLAGSLSGEGSPMTWAATHRLHHHKSDQPGDPHSPLIGAWWSHIMWLFVYRKNEDTELLWQRYIPELTERPIMRFFERTFVFWLFAQGLSLIHI